MFSSRSGGPLLPPVGMASSSAYHRKMARSGVGSSRRSVAGWALRLVLIAAAALALWTFAASSHSDAAAAARRAALEQAPRDVTSGGTPGGRSVAGVAAGGAAVAGAGAAAGGAANAGDFVTTGRVVEPPVVRPQPGAAPPPFDPATHYLYRSGADAVPVDPSVAMGGWRLERSTFDRAASHPAARVLSFASPRVVHFPSFLTREEVEHMLTIARERLERSQVLGGEQANSKVDQVRTSFGAWPPKDEVTDRIERRIHELVGIPREFGESLYVLKYQQGQRYEAHNDHCMDSLARGRADSACQDFLRRARGPECGEGHGGPSCGDRVATFILQLVSPTAGGRTVFPRADWTESRMAGIEHPNDHVWYCERDEVLGAAPAAGDALLFWDYEPRDQGTGTGSYANGTGDPTGMPQPKALHSGCPVTEGEKWIATRWIRGSGFDYVPPAGWNQHATHQEA